MSTPSSSIASSSKKGTKRKSGDVAQKGTKRKIGEMDQLIKVVTANTVAIHEMGNKIEQALQALHGGGKSAKVKKDKNAPKRALNPNIQFNSFVSASIRSEQPDLAQKRVLSKQGELWRSIGKEGQEAFKTFLEEQGIKGQRIKPDALPMDAFKKLNFALDYSTPPKPKGE